MIASAAALFVGCTGQSGAADGAAPQAAPPQTQDWQAPLLRPESYFRAQARVDRAEKLLTRGCMHDRGLVLDIVPDETDPVMGRSVSRLRFRQARGFGGIVIDPTLNEQEEARRDRWLLAFGGDPDDRVGISTPLGQVSSPRVGCLADARTELAGSVQGMLEGRTLANDHMSVQDRWIDEQPSLYTALRAWSACMALRGYDFDTPAWIAASYHELRQASGSEAPLPGEIDAAVADGECQDEGYLDVLNGLRADYLDTLTAADVSRLKESAHIRDRMDANARRVLAELDPDWTPP